MFQHLGFKHPAFSDPCCISFQLNPREAHRVLAPCQSSPNDWNLFQKLKSSCEMQCLAKWFFHIFCYTLVFECFLGHFTPWFFPSKNLPRRRNPPFQLCHVGAMEWSEAWRGMSQEGVTWGQVPAVEGGTSCCCLLVGKQDFWWRNFARNQNFFWILTFLFLFEGHFEFLNGFFKRKPWGIWLIFCGMAMSLALTETCGLDFLGFCVSKLPQIFRWLRTNMTGLGF